MRKRAKKILIVDDDHVNCDLMSDILKAHYEVDALTSATRSIERVHQKNPDLIILDVHMPELSGFQICKSLRSDPKTERIPIIVVTGLVSLEAKIEALEMGADDFIEKPFDAHEVLACVASKLKRVQVLTQGRSAEQNVSFGPIQMDFNLTKVLLDGNEISLRATEFRLLKYFIENQNKTLSREALLSTVWEGIAVSERTVDAHIAVLRKKLGPIGNSLQTIYGFGYILKAS